MPSYRIRLYVSEKEWGEIESQWQRSRLRTVGDYIANKLLIAPAQTQSVPAQTQSVPAQTQSVPFQTQSVPFQTQSVPFQTQSVPFQTQSVPLAPQPKTEAQPEPDW